MSRKIPADCNLPGLAQFVQDLEDAGLRVRAMRRLGNYLAVEQVDLDGDAKFALYKKRHD